MRVPEYGWTTQKVFHLMNFVVNGGDYPRDSLWKFDRNFVFFFLVCTFGTLSSMFCWLSLLCAVRAVLFGFHMQVFLVHPKVRMFSTCFWFLHVLIWKRLILRLHLISIWCCCEVLQALCWVLLDLPGLLFFSAYTLLVLFWAEIYHQVPRKKILMCVDLF